MIARPVRTLPSVAALALAALLVACGGSAASPNFTTGPASPQPVATTAPSVAPTVAATEAPTVAPTEAALFPVTLTDDEGTTLTLATEPAKVVSLTPAVTGADGEQGLGRGRRQRDDLLRLGVELDRGALVVGQADR